MPMLNGFDDSDSDDNNSITNNIIIVYNTNNTNIVTTTTGSAFNTNCYYSFSTAFMVWQRRTSPNYSADTSQLVHYALLTLTCSSSRAAIFVLKVKEISRTQHHAIGTICPQRCVQLTPRTSSRINLRLFYLNVHVLFKRHCYTSI